MTQTIQHISDFQTNWSSGINFLLTGACIPFSFDLPATDRMIEGLLANPNMQAISGTIRDKLEIGNLADQYRQMSYDDLLATSFQLTHFNLHDLDKPGLILHGFHDQVMAPWKTFLRENGFTWDRCYGILRISGPQTVTGYHMDGSNVLFWNARGHKVFNGVHDPDRWAPVDWAVQSGNVHAPRPEDLTEESVHSIGVGDNQFIWNHLLTPHWVEAPALTIGFNISHGGLRYKGQLGPREDALCRKKAWDTHPEQIWRKE